MPRLLACCLLGGCLALSLPQRGLAQNQSVEGRPPNGVRKITFKQMLKTGLKARRQEEFEYIDEIVRLVNIGYLEKNMVLGTFFYARQCSSYIPLPYFQQALVDRAKKDGKKVPGLQPGTTPDGF